MRICPEEGQTLFPGFRLRGDCTSLHCSLCRIEARETDQCILSFASSSFPMRGSSLTHILKMPH
jgi:hypothetical protein